MLAILLTFTSVYCRLFARTRAVGCRLVSDMVNGNVVTPSTGQTEPTRSSTLDHDALGQAALKFPPGVSPEPLGIRRHALAGDIKALRAVSAQHFAQEPEPSPLETGEACDRRPA